MDTLRSAAHLLRELGDELFNALASSDNTGKVREFAKTLPKKTAVLPVLPTEITVGGVTYEILSILKRTEDSVKDDVMVSRAKELGANLGKEDCRHILEHEGDIPADLRGMFILVFPEVRQPDGSSNIVYVYWRYDRWILGWSWLGIWDHTTHVLRRKQPADQPTSTLPTEMTVGGVTYEIVSPLDEGEKSVVLKTIVARAEKMDANLGEDDLLHIMKHQDCIPDKLREAVFVFTGSRKPVAPRLVSILYWRNGAWEQNWDLGDSPYLDSDMPRLLRRKQPAVQSTKTLPTEMTVGGATYEILSFLKKGEGSIKRNVVVKRIKNMKANLGKEDCEFILEHQNQIPAELRDKAVFVFTNWRHPEDSGCAACVLWDSDHWVQLWSLLNGVLDDDVRVLRRKEPAVQSADTLPSATCPVCTRKVHPFNLLKDPKERVIGCYMCNGEAPVRGQG